MEQPEDIVQGWCLHCTCRPHYHIGQDGCDNCKCTDFELDNYRDALDKSNLEQMDSYTDYEDPDEEEPDFEIEEAEVFGRTVEVFMGKVSRGCTSCGMTKLYKDFNDSHDPQDLCNYCLYEQSELAQMDDTLTDEEREELIYTEDEIIENEMAFYEAQERQEFIDEFLRGLDE